MPNGLRHRVVTHAIVEVSSATSGSRRCNDLDTSTLVLIRLVPDIRSRSPVTGSCFDLPGARRSIAGETSTLLLLATSGETIVDETFVGQDKQTMTCGATCGYSLMNFNDWTDQHNGSSALTTRDRRALVNGSTTEV
jgi:hypothetical protein